MDQQRAAFDRHMGDLRGVMERAGYTKDEINNLIGSYQAVPGGVHTEVTANTSQASDAISGLQAQLDRLGMSKDKMVEIGRSTTGNIIPEKLATGGPVPGFGDGDTVPALLTPGEFVVNKDAVKAIGLDEMYRINAMRFAAGGHVGQSVTIHKAYEVQLDLAALRESIAAVVKMVEEARAREAEAARAAAAAGGGGPGGSVAGLTAAASAMVNAVLSRFPGHRMTSGRRSPEENRRVGGAPNSDHLYGRAADFAPESTPMASFLRGYPGIKQVLWQVKGHYDHVHGATTAAKGGIVPINAHAGEMVLPKHLSDAVQRTAAGGVVTRTSMARQSVPASSGTPIDYDRMAKAVAREMVRALPANSEGHGHPILIDGREVAKATVKPMSREFHSLAVSRR